MSHQSVPESVDRYTISRKKFEFPGGRTRRVPLRASLIREIAQTKMEDLNANSLDQAMHIIEGSAKSMGLQVEG